MLCLCLDEFMCIVCVSVPNVLRGRFQSPRAGVIGDYELPFGSGESNPCSLSRGKGSSLVRLFPSSRDFVLSMQIICHLKESILLEVK